MSPFGALVMFLVIWWTVLFAVLPVGVRGQHEEAENMVNGQEAGAPINSQMGRKVKITTLITLVLWAALLVIVNLELIDLSIFAIEPKTNT